MHPPVKMLGMHPPIPPPLMPLGFVAVTEVLRRRRSCYSREQEQDPDSVTVQTGFVFELVVNRLYVGDAHSLLHLNPVGSLAQNCTEAFEFRNSVVRAAGVEPRRNEVRTSFTTRTAKTHYRNFPDN